MNDTASEPESYGAIERRDGLEDDLGAGLETLAFQVLNCLGVLAGDAGDLPNVLVDALPALGGHDGWQICLSGGDCSVVYFRGPDVVLMEQMHVTPFHKADGPERKVCFCFGYSERDIVDDHRRNGRSTIRESIADGCRHGRGDCERVNPEGRCCLGSVAEVLETVQGPQWRIP